MKWGKGYQALAAGAVVLVAAWKLLRSLQRARHRVQSDIKGEEAYIKLRVVDGLSSGSEFSFAASDTITLGRKPSNTVALPDTGVSGHHCKILFDDEQQAWQLADVGSLNGTFLNRVLIAAENRSKGERRALASGDVILIGETTTLEVQCHPCNAQPTVEQSARSAGENIAQVLLNLLEQNPLPQDILDSLSTFAHDPVRLTGATIQKTGSRAKSSGTCEDACSWHLPLAPGASLCTFCVCDGHCGHQSARHVQALLPGVLQATLAGQRLHAADSLKQAMEDTFLRVDAAVDGADGCTMTLLLVDADAHSNVYIQASNVGDSAVVCADFGQMMKMHLTDNHRVSQSAEHERLEKAGALLTHNGTRLMGLNLSRSIGDRALKDENFGFIAEPYVSSVVKVEPRDSLLLVMASDGLWDVTNADLVMKIAHRILKTDPGNVELLAKCLMYHAISRRSLDDITILVMLVRSDDAGAAVAAADAAMRPPLSVAP